MTKLAPFIVILTIPLLIESGLLLFSDMLKSPDRFARPVTSLSVTTVTNLSFDESSILQVNVGFVKN